MVENDGSGRLALPGAPAAEPESGQPAAGTDMVKHDIAKTARMVKRSHFFDSAKTEEQAYAIILAGAELGFGPMAALTSIYMVKGRLSLSSALLASMVKRSPNYKYKIVEHTNQVCKIEFHERVGAGWELMGVSTWTIEDAKLADLAKGDNWKKYPRNMLFARAITNGVRWYCPDLLQGQACYTTEEIEDGIIDVPYQEVPRPQEVNPNQVGTVREDQLARISELIGKLDTSREKLDAWCVSRGFPAGIGGLSIVAADQVIQGMVNRLAQRSAGAETAPASGAEPVAAEQQAGPVDQPRAGSDTEPMDGDSEQ